MRQTLRKSEILRGRKQFDTVFTVGRRFRGTVLHCAFVISETPANSSQRCVTVGFTVRRTAFRRAVDRNLLKRRMREAYRRNKEQALRILSDETNAHRLTVVFSVSGRSNPQSGLPSYQAIERDIRHALAEIQKHFMRSTSP